MNDTRLPITNRTNTHLTRTLVIPAMLLPFIASLFYYVILAGTPVATIIYTATKIFTVAWPIFIALAIERTRIQWKKPHWKKHLTALPLGALTGLFIGGIIVGGFFLTPLGNYVHTFTADIELKVSQMGIAQPARYIAFCVFLAGLHSLIEEFFWRWYVFGRLAKTLPLWIAYFLAALAFAAHHYVVLWCYFSPAGAITFGTAVGLGGALWCWMLQKQKTLAGCWLSHAIVDAAIFIVGYQLLFT